MKRLSRTYLRRFFCALASGILLSQTVISAQEVRDSVISNFNLFEDIPHEKVYLHLDKPYYGAGEKIWFKEYLVNAVTHKDNCLSNFIITELFSSSDSLVCRKKIRRDSLGLFHNAIDLPADLPEGDYYLRAYTNWMQNTEPEFHYSRNLKIGNSLIESKVTSKQNPKPDRHDFDLTFFPASMVIESDLTRIITILAQVDWSTFDQIKIDNDFQIDTKIDHNDLVKSKAIVKEYNIWQNSVSRIYSAFDAEGLNKSLFVLQKIRSFYLEHCYKLKGDDLFDAVRNDVKAEIRKHSISGELTKESIDICSDIIVVDAFIRCRIFENPEGYSYVTA